MVWVSDKTHEYQILHKSGSWSDYQKIPKSGSWSEYQLSPSLFGLVCHNTINKIINFKEEKDTRQNTCFKILENSKQAEHLSILVHPCILFVILVLTKNVGPYPSNYVSRTRRLEGAKYI